MTRHWSVATLLKRVAQCVSGILSSAPLGICFSMVQVLVMHKDKSALIECKQTTTIAELKTLVRHDLESAQHPPVTRRGLPRDRFLVKWREHLQQMSRRLLWPASTVRTRFS